MSEQHFWGSESQLPVPYHPAGGLPSPTHVQCPGCGLFGAEIAGGTSVGCPLCYETFSQFVSPTIWQNQGSTVHHGSEPLEFTVRSQTRATIYEEAIVRAQEEGRIEDAEVLIDLLTLLQRNDG